MKHGRNSLLLVLAMFLTGCSSNFLYNQLDWLIPWWVGDYVDLNREQKKSFKAQLNTLLHWHRSEELSNYLELVDSIAADLEGPLQAEDIQRWADELWEAYERLERQTLPMLYSLGDTFSEAQMQEFMDALYKDQKKLEKKYLNRSEEEFREESYEDFRDNMSDFLGRLEPVQKERLQLASQQLQRFDDAWLQQRRDWLDTLGGILLNRQEGWQQQVDEALERREELQSDAYREGYINNQQVIFEAIADVLNERTEKQSARLTREVEDIRESLQKLIKATPSGGLLQS